MAIVVATPTPMAPADRAVRIFCPDNDIHAPMRQSDSLIDAVA
jgi:hypothetical protein